MNMETMTKLNNIITAIFAIVGVLGIFKMFSSKIQIKLDFIAIAALLFGVVYNVFYENLLMFVIYLFDMVGMAIGMIKYTKIIKFFNYVKANSTEIS